VYSRLVVVVLAGACGRLAFDPVTDSGAGPNGDAGVIVDAPANAVTVTFGETGTTTFSGVTFDCYLDNRTSEQANNFGTAPTLQVDGSSNGKIALLRFDTSAIPSTATLFSASIDLYVEDPTVDMLATYGVLEAWDEGTANGTAGTANWTDRQPGVAWTAQGVYSPSSSSAYIGQLTPSTGLVTVSVPLSATFTQTWITNPSRNHGVVIRGFGNDPAIFASREATDPTTRPMLTIIYVP